MQTNQTEKRVSIFNHLKKQPMDTQLKIEEKVMRHNLSPDYRFTKHNHFEIIDILEKHREHHNINKTEFSYMAGCGKSTYVNLTKCNQRFSKRSYTRYRELITKLNGNNEPKPVYAPAPSTPHVPNTQNQLNEEVCINFLKATGKYKISKLETITNWVEL
jgi:hypothetical protein